ncbi:MAG: hypothetical protein J5J06_19540 [Phycisphaerae bacterium]|nr:hypothetical protein [Phycisphaerae bacterium]
MTQGDGQLFLLCRPEDGYPRTVRRANPPFCYARGSYDRVLFDGGCVDTRTGEKFVIRLDIDRIDEIPPD